MNTQTDVSNLKNSAGFVKKPNQKRKTKIHLHLGVKQKLLTAATESFLIS